MIEGCDMGFLIIEKLHNHQLVRCQSELQVVSTKKIGFFSDVEGNANQLRYHMITKVDYDNKIMKGLI